MNSLENVKVLNNEYSCHFLVKKKYKNMDTGKWFEINSGCPNIQLRRDFGIENNFLEIEVC